LRPAPDWARPADDRWLFVYGTLRRGFARHGLLSKLGARFVASGRVRGAPYNLGRFPGAIEEEPGWICGEVYSLPDIRRAFRLLDSVEGFHPRAPETSFFRRARTAVALASSGEGGPRLSGQAWIYWLNRKVPAMRPIESGDFACP
jgi:gamma-glutamylcyclotransferase (GGCT)/AIG2-like uncharacterized protein YtfP